MALLCQVFECQVPVSLQAIDSTSTIGFQLNALCLRGTSVSWYLLMEAVEEILHKSVFICYHKHDKNNNAERIAAFQKRFGEGNVIAYDSPKEIDSILTRKKASHFIIKKAGHRDSIISTVAKNVVVCVFTATAPHGEVYMKLMDTVPGNAPILPNIVRFPEDRGYNGTQEEARRELGLPLDRVIFGRHGGYESVMSVAQDAIKQYPEHLFVLMNTKPFTKMDHVRHLDASVNWHDISRFITACDAMIHSRERGETFGNSCAEFAVHGKPVLTWSKSKERAHIDILGQNAILYSTKDDLLRIFQEWHSLDKPSPTKLRESYSQFTKQNVTRVLNEHAHIT